MIKNCSDGKYIFRFLGSVEVVKSGQRIEKRLPKKGLAFLAYLFAYPGVEHPRQKLADFFWPDSGEAARSNLRQVLLGVKRCLNVDSGLLRLVSDRHFIRLDASQCLVDITEFQTPIPECSFALNAAGCPLCLERLEALSGLYRGDLLDGLVLEGSADFEDWLQVQRDLLQQRALFLFERLAGCLEGLGRFDKALHFAQRFMALAPWSDEGIRRVIRLAAMGGQRGFALSQYQSFCRTLKDELGVQPETKTRKLAQSIQNRDLSSLSSTGPISAHQDCSQQSVDRRQVSICYCQLIPLETQDVEDEFELLKLPLQRCEKILVSGMAHIATNGIGRGVLAFFGYPQALEKAALLATRAALSLAAQSFPGVQISIGICTDMVLSSPGTDQPDLTSRASSRALGLSNLAGDREIVISETTRRLVHGSFTFVRLGEHRLPGKARPEICFKIIRNETSVTGTPHSEALPLVGRSRELNLIKRFWHSACEGKGKALLLLGEPGIGKSRLMASFKESLTEPTYTVLEIFCSYEDRQSPFKPIADLFDRLLDSAETENSASRLETLTQILKLSGTERIEEVPPLTGDLPSIPGGQDRMREKRSTYKSREFTLALMVELLARLTAKKNVCLLLEDLHWVDPSTLEVLSQLIHNGLPNSLFLLLSARPDFVSPWPESEVHQLSLPPLPDEAIRRMIISVSPKIQRHWLDRLVGRADGVPLFAEQLCRMPKTAALDERAIPMSLQDLLAARLDRLGQDKRLTQLAATIGRQFSSHLLAALSLRDEQEVLTVLFRLKREGIFILSAKNLWQFRHALIGDAAYMSQTRADRESAHRQIAELFETEMPVVCRNQPEILAFHWSQAGRHEAALNYWIRAGKLMQGQGAHQEAVKHFTAGLQALETLQDAAARRALGWQMQVGLGACAYAIEGYASSNGATAYNRAVELSEQGGNLTKAFPPLWGLWAGASSHSSWGHSLQRAQRLVHMVKHSKDPIMRQQSYFAVGNVQFWRGEFVVARDYLQRAITLYNPDQHDELIGHYGENAFVTSSCYLSWCLCLLGRSEQALQAGRAAVEEAKRRDHPFSLGYALTFHTVLHRMLRQPSATLELAEQTVSLAHKHDLPLWQVGATLNKGWAQVRLGRPEGFAEMQWSVEQVESLMGGIVPIFLETQADGLLYAERPRAALDVIDKALGLVECLDDHHAEAELYRLKGLCLLNLGNADLAQAESAFRAALKMSRKKNALLYELRAARALANLYVRKNQAARGRSLLTASYQRFAEGFNSPDLKSAEQLIKELNF